MLTSSQNSKVCYIFGQSGRYTLVLNIGSKVRHIEISYIRICISGTCFTLYARVLLCRYRTKADYLVSNTKIVADSFFFVVSRYRHQMLKSYLLVFFCLSVSFELGCRSISNTIIMCSFQGNEMFFFFSQDQCVHVLVSFARAPCLRYD